MAVPPPEAVVVDGVHPTLEVDEEALAGLVRRVVAGEGAALHYVGVVLADHATVLDLNRTYLQHDYHTDVLSFPLGDDPDAVDGEVYVDVDTARERHDEFGVSFEDEVRRYVVHGVLHLLGYDDAAPEDKAAMHALEDRYLSAG